MFSKFEKIKMKTDRKNLEEALGKFYFKFDKIFKKIVKFWNKF